METYKRYLPEIGIAGRELFAQFFIRIYKEIPDCIIAEFSKLKVLQSSNFKAFRNVFKAQLKECFLVPSNTFDNVKGQFPIGFFVWDTSVKESFKEFTADVYNASGERIQQKRIISYDNLKNISDWIIETRHRPNEKIIGFMSSRSDVQNINLNFIINSRAQLPHPRGTDITEKNLVEICIFYAVNHSVDASWLNDRDMFMYPKDEWKSDEEFQWNCIALTLFNNYIQSAKGTNYWIPFTESQVGAKRAFSSHFMTEYLEGRIVIGEKTIYDENDPFSQGKVIKIMSPKVQFSPEASAVMEAGRDLWTYYHSVPDANPDAAFYDIKEYFQGRDIKTGKMNNSSDDPDYNEKISALRNAEKNLKEKIAEKVYEYGFLI